MKKACVIMCVSVLAAASSFGRTIADQLQVAECSFRLYDGPTEVEILDQMVTMRAFEKSNGDLKTFGSAYHIEIAYKGDPINMEAAVIEFLDKDKRPLHAITVEDESRFMRVETLGHRPRPKTQYIAISLEGIPLRVLDEVISIRIKKG